MKLRLRSKNIARTCTNLHDRKSMQEPVLDFVINALQEIRETNGRCPRASRAALEQLQISPRSDDVDHTSDKSEMLAAVRDRVRACVKCQHLACSRTQT